MTAVFAWTALILACCALVVSTYGLVSVIRSGRETRAILRRVREKNDVVYHLGRPS